MNHLKKFEAFTAGNKKDLNLREHYDYIDSLIPLNEGLIGDDKIKDIWSKIVNRVKGLSNSTKRKVVTYGIAALLATGSIGHIVNVINNYQTEDTIIKDAANRAISKFKDPTKLRVSSRGRESIREHEKIKLVAYDLKDGHITVGYGHAEPILTSNFKNGQRISKNEADLLFQKDLKRAADGVRRIFKEWKLNGVDRKITQDQFDVLVSMSFNMGIGGLRQSDLIQKIKLGYLEEAGELIKTTNIDDDAFPGLRIRREKESKVFLSFLKNTQSDQS